MPLRRGQLHRLAVSPAAWPGVSEIRRSNKHAREFLTTPARNHRLLGCSGADRYKARLEAFWVGRSTATQAMAPAVAWPGRCARLPQPAIIGR